MDDIVIELENLYKQASIENSHYYTASLIEKAINEIKNLRNLLNINKVDNKFVIHRLRSKPVEYTITIKHFVSGGEWTMSANLNGVDKDEESKKRIAFDLRMAADWLQH